MWVYQDYWRDYKPELGSAAPAAGMTYIIFLIFQVACLPGKISRLAITAVRNYGHFQKFHTTGELVWYTSGWRLFYDLSKTASAYHYLRSL
jgi:hypothetical protein